MHNSGIRVLFYMFFRGLATGCVGANLSGELLKVNSLWNVWTISLQWRHNDRDGVSNHRHPDCLLNRLFRCRSKKTSQLRFTGLCDWKPPVTVDSPHKGTVSRKRFLFDDVIMMGFSVYARPYKLTYFPDNCRDDSRFAPSQWETALLCNDVSLWLGASLESALSLW